MQDVEVRPIRATHEGVQCTFNPEHAATWVCSCFQPSLHLCGTCLSLHLETPGAHVVATVSSQGSLQGQFLERREELRRRLTQALDCAQALEEVGFRALDLAPPSDTPPEGDLKEAQAEAAQITVALQNARTKVKYAASLLEGSTNPSIQSVGANLRKGLEATTSPAEQGEQLGVAMDQLASALVACQTDTRAKVPTSSLLTKLQAQLESIFPQMLSVAEAAERPELFSQCYQTQMESDPEVRLPNQLQFLSNILQEAETGLRSRALALRKAKHALSEAAASQITQSASHRRTISAESLGELLDTVEGAIKLEPVDLRLRQPAAPQPPESSSSLRHATEILLQKLRVPLDQVQLTSRLTLLERAEGLDRLAQEQALVLWEMQQAAKFLDEGLQQDPPSSLSLSSICSGLMETLELLSSTEAAAVRRQTRQLAALQKIHGAVERLSFFGKALSSRSLPALPESSDWSAVQEGASQATDSLVRFLDIHGQQEWANIGRERLSASPHVGDALGSVNEKLTFMRDALAYAGVNYLESIGQMLMPVFQASVGNLRTARDLMPEGEERAQVDSVLAELESARKREVKGCLESAEAAMQRALEEILPPEESEEARQHSLYEALKAATLRSRLRAGVHQTLMVSEHIASLLPACSEKTSFQDVLARVKSPTDEEEDTVDVLSLLLDQLALVVPLVRQGSSEDRPSRCARLTLSTESYEEIYGSMEQRPFQDSIVAPQEELKDELGDIVAEMIQEMRNLTTLLTSTSEVETHPQSSGVEDCLVWVLSEIKCLSAALRTQPNPAEEVLKRSLETLAEFGVTLPHIQREERESIPFLAQTGSLCKMVLSHLSALQSKAQALQVEAQQCFAASSMISRLKVILDVIIGPEFKTAWKPVARASPFEKLRVISTNFAQYESSIKQLEAAAYGVQRLVPLLQQCNASEVRGKLETGDIVGAATEGLALWLAERKALAKALDMPASMPVKEVMSSLEAGLAALCESAGVHSSNKRLSEVRNKVETLKFRTRSLKTQLNVMLRDVEQEVKAGHKAKETTKSRLSK